MCSGIGERPASASSAEPRPFSVSPAGCRPRASSRSSSVARRASWWARSSSSSASAGASSGSLRRAIPIRWLSATMRCWAPSCRSRPMRWRSPSAASRTRARAAATSAVAGAQRGLMAAALDLGAGARGEDPQDRELVLVGPDRLRGHQRDVGDVLLAGARQRDAEVGVQSEVADVAIARIGLAGPLGQDEQPLALDGRARHRVVHVELVALAQLDAVLPRGEHAHATRGGRREVLADERQLGVVGGGEMADHRAQEGVADDAGRAGREATQEVAVARAGRVLGRFGGGRHCPRMVAAQTARAGAATHPRRGTTDGRIQTISRPSMGLSSRG